MPRPNAQKWFVIQTRVLRPLQRRWDAVRRALTPSTTRSPTTTDTLRVVIQFFILLVENSKVESLDTLTQVSKVLDCDPDAVQITVYSKPISPLGIPAAKLEAARAAKAKALALSS